MKKDFTKRIKQGNWTLEHRRYRDDWGFLRDAFEMIETHADRRKTHYPFIAPITVGTYDQNTPITDVVSDYSDDDYVRIFDEQKRSL